MKRLSTLLVTVLLTISVFSQAPQKMSYQAVVRNSADMLVTSSSIGMQISILQGSESGTPVYVETHTPTTNVNGLVTLEIGSGTPVTGAFADIEWSTGTYFLKTETDPAGGTSYSIIGTSQLLSVPYALHAKSAEVITGDIDYNEVDPVFNTSEAANITTADISNLSNLSGTNTGDQDLSPFATKNMGDENITNLADPVNDMDAVNKAYVDHLESKVKSLEQDLISTGAYNPTDADGNTYKVVKIGDQIWMSENLRTTKYSNGEPIGTTTPLTLDITGEIAPKYQWVYNGDESNAEKLGRLYTWYVAVDNRNVCPAGWHVPSDADWNNLTDYLLKNGYGYGGSGGALAKSIAATSGWIASDTPGVVGNDQESNNSTGFTGYSSGIRSIGHFDYLGTQSIWWASSESSSTTGLCRILYNGLNFIHTGTDLEKYYGFSIRCLKDASLTSNATTEIASNINSSSAQLNATVNPKDLSTLIIFEFGTSSNYGSTVTASQSPARGNTTASVNANITGLELGTTYHYRVKTVNSLGTSYGSDMSFTTDSIISATYGMYTIKSGTDELYFIDFSDNSTTMIANIGVTIPDGFTGIQYVNGTLYIVTYGKLYTYEIESGLLNHVITNNNLAWQFSINSDGDIYSVNELSGMTQGSMYKIDISSNTSTLIGKTGTPSVWGLGFDSNDQLWAVDEFYQKYGTMNTSTGAFVPYSSALPYPNIYCVSPDNNGNLYSYHGNENGILKFNISSGTATLIIPWNETWSLAGVAYGAYYSK